MVDIDHFKSVNDRFGHAVGDKVIAVGCHSDRIFEAKRSGRTIWRRGVLCCPAGCRVDDAVEIAERMRLAAGGHGAKFTNAPVSPQVWRFDHDRGRQNSSQLVEQADKALYVAKESGRNRVIRWSSMIEEETRRKIIRNPRPPPILSGKLQSKPLIWRRKIFNAAEVEEKQVVRC